MLQLWCSCKRVCTVIKKVWWWVDGKKVFDSSIQDDRDPQTRTREELQKSFDDVFAFLKLTIESENMFKTGYLSTLDFQTKISLQPSFTVCLFNQKL